jgi:hypothetical protein
LIRFPKLYNNWQDIFKNQNVPKPEINMRH